jgi:hypothetical protein
MRVYPANLCPFLGDVEFSGLRQNLGKAVRETIKTAAGAPSGKVRRNISTSSHLIYGIDKNFFYFIAAKHTNPL